MTTANNMDEPILQKFKDEQDEVLDSLPTHVDSETNVRYILWSDIQDRFVDVSYIKNEPWRVFFMPDNDHQAYVFTASILNSLQHIKLTVPLSLLSFTIG